MPPVLYHVPRTISSPLVQLVLELDLIDKREIVVQEMTFAELKSPEHLAINIMGTSPAFKCNHNGLCMWESGAILDFLLERHDTQCQFHPPPVPGDASVSKADLQRRTKFLQLKQFILATVYPFLSSMYIYTLQGGALDDEYMTAAKKKCHACMGPALADALGDGPYFLGSQISAIDFLAAKPLGNADSMGLLSDFPQLKELLERVRARPTYRPAYESLSVGTNQQLEQAPAPHPDTQELVLVPKPRNED